MENLKEQISVRGSDELLTEKLCKASYLQATLRCVSPIEAIGLLQLFFRNDAIGLIERSVSKSLVQSNLFCSYSFLGIHSTFLTGCGCYMCIRNLIFFWFSADQSHLGVRGHFGHRVFLIHPALILCIRPLEGVALVTKEVWKKNGGDTTSETT